MQGCLKGLGHRLKYFFGLFEKDLGMGMVIQHNLTAFNSNRQLGITTGLQAKSSEKLSSGYKINRAADDAAGLAISEKMRRQIRGLEQGSYNIQEGISFLQVADGAMDQVHEMLQRINELAVKAANQTNTDEDRAFIDGEVQQIKKEIDRISNATEFNNKPVFFEAGKAVETKTPTANSKFFQLLGSNVTKTGYMQEAISSEYLKGLNYTNANNIDGANPYTGVHIDFGSVVNGGNIKSLSGTQFYVNCCTDCCATVVNFVDSVGTNVSGDVPSSNIKKVINIGVKKSETEYYSDASEFSKSIVDSLKSISGHVEFANDGSKLLIYDIDPSKWSEASKQLAYFCDTSNFYNPGTMVNSAMWIQMSSEKDDGVYFDTGDISLTALGIATTKVNPFEDALQAIDSVKSALNYASRVRSHIGAQQNRLEHSYANNRNVEENTQAAESRIRDTDMAAEMVKYSNNNILMQAGQSMLAQANQTNQGVLALLQ